VDDIIVLGVRKVKDLEFVDDPHAGGYTIRSGMFDAPHDFHRERWHVRKPAHTATIATGGGISTKWHFDGNEKTSHVILWTNIYPTQLRNKVTKKIYIPNNNEVVLFNNRNLEHRTDPKAIEAAHAGRLTNRWFARLILHETPSQEEIAQWQRILAMPVSRDSPRS
jgi:hypothetical protein